MYDFINLTDSLSIIQKNSRKFTLFSISQPTLYEYLANYTISISMLQNKSNHIGKTPRSCKYALSTEHSPHILNTRPIPFNFVAINYYETIGSCTGVLCHFRQVF